MHEDDSFVRGFIRGDQRGGQAQAIEGPETDNVFGGHGDSYR
jgi:hypothetical protein